MPSDLRPGPDSPPTDELQSAEASLGVLLQVVHTVAAEDATKQTPCTEFDVSGLTEHLLNSITALGGMVGADFSGLGALEGSHSVEQLIVAAARPALDAWHRHGLEGEVSLGQGSMPARVAVAVFSLEFLVHGWDYGVAVGRQVEAPEPLAEYVLGLAQPLIKPHERSVAGFDPPLSMSDDAPALDRLIGFTGRNPGDARTGPRRTPR